VTVEAGVLGFGEDDTNAAIKLARPYLTPISKYLRSAGADEETSSALMKYLGETGRELNPGKKDGA
jgi:hypothetical protein